MKNFTITIIVLGYILIYSCTNNSTTTTAWLPKDSVIKSIDTIKNNDLIINQSSNCITVVTELLTTSQRYKQITNGLEERVKKNGGTGYGFIIEGSPNPTQDSALVFSKTYDFSLHETYPDRDPVIARFSFDKAKRQLYELDVVLDSLVPVDFNKKLLQNLDKACN